MPGVAVSVRAPRMDVSRLRLSGMRGFEAAEWRPQPGMNLVLGENGAGKTTLLEALHLLAHGRSFRGRVRDGLVRQGQAALEVYAEWQDASRRPQRGGLRHTGSAWEARLDGAAVQTLADLCAAIAVVSFEPGSHELISGGADQRRRFLDWALFHVEPSFLPVWRRYARALRQRNALLKQGLASRDLDAWDDELAQAGTSLHQLREFQVERWTPCLFAELQHVLPELGEPSLTYIPGWRAAERTLAESLAAGRERDLALGHTVGGPHRADWRVDFPGLPGREALSRGQAKLVALSAILGQAAQFAQQRGEWPVIALDDIGSELDAGHQARVFGRLVETGAQVLMTGTEPPSGLTASGAEPAVFHVEHRAVHAGPPRRPPVGG